MSSLASSHSVDLLSDEEKAKMILSGLDICMCSESYPNMRTVMVFTFEKFPYKSQLYFHPLHACTFSPALLRLAHSPKLLQMDSAPALSLPFAFF